ncbi:uncharacterized protein LOC131206641 [Anopheles bellator]|uniref:uncharacterized protein LOC131206641 n=1 Tax=Anopheles bellator TaxID=139047 RepID=UPI002649FCDC|nr:uncharacterized protein LOC131206641 [Anopheles bellator]
MFTCQCLNVSIATNDETVLERLKTNSNLSRPVIGELQTTPRELVSFFKEAIGPLAEVDVRVRLVTLLKTIPFEGWKIGKCVNCDCHVFARDARNLSNLFVNASLATTNETISRLATLENYSQTYKLVLDPRSNGFRGFFRKEQYRGLFTAAANTVDSTNDRNELLETYREFMLAKTQAANERIARFTQEQNELLSAIRDRAEQDFLFLAQTFVPELVDSASGTAAGTALLARSDSDRRMVVEEEQSQPVMGDDGQQRTEDGSTVVNSSKALEQLLAAAATSTGSVTPSAVGSEMETPPPTPECMPMSTGNSPPSIAATSASGGSTSSSVASKTNGARSVVGPLDGGAGSAASVFQNRAGVFNTTVGNTINNNHTKTTTTTGSIDLGAINNKSTPAQQLHSISTNRFANHPSPMAAPVVSSGGDLTMTGTASSHARFSGGQQQQSSPDSDCLFDIDGMENDKTPPPDTFSDEDECDFDDATDNNNREGGVCIPRYQQYGRQHSSIAKSLPISAPKTMTQFRANEDDLDEMTEDNVDIAASIKALAKSVHGDAVFGDLPRPQVQRFPSQI